MKSVAVTLSSLVLVACGGGGGGSTTTATPTAATPIATTPTTTTPASSTAAVVALSSTNQSTVAQESSSSAFLLLSSAQLVTGAQAADEAALVGFAKSMVDKLPLYIADAKANSTLTGVVPSQTYACAYGGTLSASVVDADNNGLISAGDSVTATSNNCKEWMGTITGSLAFSVSSLVGTFGVAPYNWAVTMKFSNFAVASAQYSSSINGSLTLNENYKSINSNSQTISTPLAEMSATYAGVTRTRTLSSYSATSTTVPDATYVYLRSDTVSGVVSSSALSSQSVTFSTPTTMVRRGTDTYPSSGVFLITGANNSQLKLTAVSATQVRQDLDANGDGTFESTSTVAWNTLL
ncbi:MAG: hypothetical protein FD135_3982 [Comamonadaceae bacterium]|nr:MAG: hypothetical protein FD135_3982 [Comamonadaceae bacterium]